MPQGQAAQFDYIGTKGVTGFFFEALEQFDGKLWLDPLANRFDSTQDTETYAGLGTAPALREWVGGKDVKGFSEYSLRISNKDFEASVRFKNKDLRRDKTGQVQMKMGELAERTLSHDAKLISTLINNGTSSTNGYAYDGKVFFATNHAVGGSGTINNAITSDISTLPVATHGSTTAPSVAEAALSIQAGVSQIFGFKDDQGEPANEFASEFIVMSGIGLGSVIQAAVNSVFVEQGFNNPLLFNANNTGSRITLRPIQNPRITATDTIYIFRADSVAKAFIIQLEMPTQMKVLAQGSDHEFFNNEQIYSVEKSGNVGYGRFDRACSVQLV